MAEINYFEIIQNKLDALVEKIIQKENMDEDFRITYAQILEKINTKMDIFSNDDTEETVKLVAGELSSLIKDRQEIVDAKFNAVKNEFDNLNSILANSLKTTEILVAFEKIQSQMQRVFDEQESHKLTLNAIINAIESIGSLEETNDIILSNYAIIKEQNVALNDNSEKLLTLIDTLSTTLEENHEKTIGNFNYLTKELEDLSSSLSDDFKEVKTQIDDKVNVISEKIENTDTALSLLSSNFATLMQVIGDLFEDEEFQKVKTDVAAIIVKTTVISEAVKQIATKEEIAQYSEKNKEELAKHKEDLKKYTKDVIDELEKKLLTNLDFSALDDIKDYTEKMFYQGTEVLKEEMWSIKDSFNDFNAKALKQEHFDTKYNELKTISEASNKEIIENVLKQNHFDEKINEIKAISESTNKELTTNTLKQEHFNNQFAKLKDLAEATKTDLTDIISEESVAAASQLAELSSTIQDLKNAISDIILNEQNEQITTALHDLQAKFVTQIVQIADNISFVEEAEEINENILVSADEIKEKITADIAEIKDSISNFVGQNDIKNEKFEDVLNKIDKTINSDISNDLKAVISGLKLLTSGMLDDNDHIYTMPDIETDLSKIRLELNKIQKSILASDDENAESGNDITSKLKSIKSAIDKLQESTVNSDIAEIKGLFNGVNEDIASISKRTNKLILASDEVNKALKSNISSFSVLIGSFEKQSREFYNSAFMLDLNDRIENLAKMSASLVQSDQAMNEAFMYLGEWIDSTSDSFDELRADVTKIRKSLLSDESGIAEKLEFTVNALAQKVELQESKIDAIDEKLNKLLAQQQETKEAKSLLEYISSQVSLTNEKVVENDALMQKIAAMEKQLKKIEKNVTAITEYLDEDDTEYFDNND